MPQTPVTDYTKVSTTVLGAQFAPAVTALSGGGYVIVWQDSSAGAVYAQRYSASGQPVGSELHLDSTQGGQALWVSVAATAGDGFVIAYQAGSFAQAEIYAHRYDSANNPSGGIIAVNTTSPNEQYNPHVTALENGAMLFTWDTRFTSGSDDVFQEVRGRIYTSDGQAFGNDFVVAPMSATVENGFSAIASLPGGGFVVTWQTGTPMGTDNFEVVAQRFTSSGAAIGSPFQVNTSTPNSQYGNDVARLSDGGFVVTWVDAPGSNGGGRILARHYDASGAAIGGEILIDSKASGGYGRTVVTALANGAYVVGWMENDSADNNVLARQMGSNDVPVGAAFEMAFDSPFGANFFSDGAVTLANGNVVFAWDGPSVTPPGGQGTGEDVYMRVYNFTAAGGPIVGTPGPDVLAGTAGDDVIQGLGDNDILAGLGGVDQMEGGTGNDTYYVDNVGDVIVETAGQGFDAVYVSTSYTLAVGADVEWLAAYKTADTTALNLTGNAIGQYLVGNQGANILDGGAGADIMIGYGGDDSYRVDNFSDQVLESAGGGSDTVLTSVSYSLGGGSGVDVEHLATTSDAGTAAINLYGNGLGQTLTGNAGVNILNGGSGADAMAGLGGNDTYYVDDAGDTIAEGAGAGFDSALTSISYTLGAGAEVEWLSTTITAGTDAINLTGNGFDQFLYGNAGANVLDGKGGADILVGLGGADTFQFTTAPGGANVDLIADFVSGTDKIALDDAVFTAIGGLGALNANAFVTGAAAGDADDRIIYNSANGQLFYDADGNGAGAAVLFATLQGHPALAFSDFQVI